MQLQQENQQLKQILQSKAAELQAKGQEFLAKSQIDQQADALRDPLDQVSGDARVSPLFVDALERHPIGVHAHADRFCLGDIGLFLCVEFNRGSRFGRDGQQGNAGKRREKNRSDQGCEERYLIAGW